MAETVGHDEHNGLEVFSQSFGQDAGVKGWQLERLGRVGRQELEDGRRDVRQATASEVGRTNDSPSSLKRGRSAAVSIRV